MPAKGKRRIPDKQKAEIVIAKELKPNGMSTNSQLAASFDVAENTVAKAKYELLTPEQKELYHQLKAELGEKALFGAVLALEKGQQLVQQAETVRDLQGVTSYGKFAHDVFRLETGQSTSNLAVSVLDAEALQYKHFRERGLTPEEIVEAMRGPLELGSGDVVDAEILPNDSDS